MVPIPQTAIVSLGMVSFLPRDFVVTNLICIMSIWNVIYETILGSSHYSSPPPESLDKNTPPPPIMVC